MTTGPTGAPARINPTDPARRAWAAHLAEDETILWQGQPDQRLIRLRARDAYLIPFFLVWGGIPTVGLLFDPMLILLVVPLLFAGIALYMLIGRFLVDGKRRRATAYLLTDRKALVVQSWPTILVRDQPLGPGTPVSREAGGLRFGPSPGTASGGPDMLGLAPTGVVFEAIPDADLVHGLAVRARDRHRDASA